MGGPRSRDMKTLASLRRFGFSRHLRGAPGRFELRQKRARSAASFIVYLRALRATSPGGDERKGTRVGFYGLTSSRSLGLLPSEQRNISIRFDRSALLYTS